MSSMVPAFSVVIIVMMMSCSNQPLQQNGETRPYGAAGSSAVAKPIDTAAAGQTYTGVVELFHEQDGKITVSFTQFAAIYYLERSHPQFESYFRMLQFSAKDRRAVRFRYRTDGQVLTFIEAVP